MADDSKSKKRKPYKRPSGSQAVRQQLQPGFDVMKEGRGPSIPLASQANSPLVDPASVYQGSTGNDLGGLRPGAATPPASSLGDTVNSLKGGGPTAPSGGPPGAKPPLPPPPPGGFSSLDDIASAMRGIDPTVGKISPGGMPPASPVLPSASGMGTGIPSNLPVPSRGNLPVPSGGNLPVPGGGGGRLPPMLPPGAGGGIPGMPPNRLPAVPPPQPSRFGPMATGIGALGLGGLAAYLRGQQGGPDSAAAAPTPVAPGAGGPPNLQAPPSMSQFGGGAPQAPPMPPGGMPGIPPLRPSLGPDPAPPPVPPPTYAQPGPALGPRYNDAVPVPRPRPPQPQRHPPPPRQQAQQAAIIQALQQPRFVPGPVDFRGQRYVEPTEAGLPPSYLNR